MRKEIYLTLKPIPDVTVLPLVVEVTTNLGYFIITAANFDIYGYGESPEEAGAMLNADLMVLKDDILEGLVNETNTDPRKLAALKAMFGIKEEEQDEENKL